jgi:hypothetical protein
MKAREMVCVVAAVASISGSSFGANVVGYANVQTPIGFTFQSSPFNTGVSNGANEVIVNTGTRDGDQLCIWKGHGWEASYLDSTQPTGFSDSGGGMVPAPILSSGQGYLYVNNQGGSNTITYVGNVRIGTNIILIPSTGDREYSALGSPLPFRGGITSILGFTNYAGALDGNAIMKLKTTASGVPKGFEPAYFDSTQPSTGFSDSGGNPVPEPQIDLGEGFLFDNMVGPAVTWTQVFIL